MWLFVREKWTPWLRNNRCKKERERKSITASRAFPDLPCRERFVSVFVAEIQRLAMLYREFTYKFVQHLPAEEIYEK